VYLRARRELGLEAPVLLVHEDYEQSADSLSASTGTGRAMTVFSSSAGVTGVGYLLVTSRLEDLI